MNTNQIGVYEGALLKQARHNDDERLVHALAGGVVSERRLRRVYDKMKDGFCKRRR